MFDPKLSLAYYPMMPAIPMPSTPTIPLFDPGIIPSISVKDEPTFDRAFQRILETEITLTSIDNGRHYPPVVIGLETFALEVAQCLGSDTEIQLVGDSALQAMGGPERAHWHMAVNLRPNESATECKRKLLEFVKTFLKKKIRESGVVPDNQLNNAVNTAYQLTYDPPTDFGIRVKIGPRIIFDISRNTDSHYSFKGWHVSISSLTRGNAWFANVNRRIRCDAELKLVATQIRSREFFAVNIEHPLMAVLEATGDGAEIYPDDWRRAQVELNEISLEQLTELWCRLQEAHPGVRENASTYDRAQWIQFLNLLLLAQSDPKLCTLAAKMWLDWQKLLNRAPCPFAVMIRDYPNLTPSFLGWIQSKVFHAWIQSKQSPVGEQKNPPTSSTAAPKPSDSTVLQMWDLPFIAHRLHPRPIAEFACGRERRFLRFAKPSVPSTPYDVARNCTASVSVLLQYCAIDLALFNPIFDALGLGHASTPRQMINVVQEIQDEWVSSKLQGLLRNNYPQITNTLHPFGDWISYSQGHLHLSRAASRSRSRPRQFQQISSSSSAHPRLPSQGNASSSSSPVTPQITATLKPATARGAESPPPLRGRTKTQQIQMPEIPPKVVPASVKTVSQETKRALSPVPELPVAATTPTVIPKVSLPEKSEPVKVEPKPSIKNTVAATSSQVATIASNSLPSPLKVATPPQALAEVPNLQSEKPSPVITAKEATPEASEEPAEVTTTTKDSDQSIKAKKNKKKKKKKPAVEDVLGSLHLDLANERKTNSQGISDPKIMEALIEYGCLGPLAQRPATLLDMLRVLTEVRLKAESPESTTSIWQAAMKYVGHLVEVTISTSDDEPQMTNQMLSDFTSNYWNPTLMRLNGHIALVLNNSLAEQLIRLPLSCGFLQRESDESKRSPLLIPAFKSIKNREVIAWLKEPFVMPIPLETTLMRSLNPTQKCNLVSSQCVQIFAPLITEIFNTSAQRLDGITVAGREDGQLKKMYITTVQDILTRMRRALVIWSTTLAPPDYECHRDRLIDIATRVVRSEDVMKNYQKMRKNYILMQHANLSISQAREIAIRRLGLAE